MKRVFPPLAVADLILLCAAAVLGLSVEGQRLYPQHFGLALFATVLTVLLHVVVFTYFTASGKLMTQAVTIGRLDRDPLQQIAHFKRRITRCVALAYAVLLTTVALGALIDNQGRLHGWHGLCGALTILVNAVIFHIENDLIVRNGCLIAEVFAAYDAARDRADS